MVLSTVVLHSVISLLNSYVVIAASLRMPELAGVVQQQLSQALV